MLHVYISGQIRNKRKVEEFCYNCLEHFFKGRLKRNIDIDIRISKTLDGNVAGGCYGDHSHVVVEIAQGDNLLEQFNPYEYKEIIVTLAHELVHAKQYIRKEPTQIEESEVEAYNLEYSLYDLYWGSKTKF